MAGDRRQWRLLPSARRPVATRAQDSGPRYASTAAVYAVLAGVLAAAGFSTVGGETVPTREAYLARSSIAGHTTLRVGIAVPDWESRFTSADLASFEGQLATYRGKALRMPAQFVVVSSTEELLYTLRAGRVDIALGALTVTPNRSQRAEFAGPYLITGTSLLVSASVRGDAWSILDRRKVRVCVTGNSLQPRPPVLDNGTAMLVRSETVHNCVQKMLDKTVNVVLDDTAQLVRYADDVPVDAMPVGVRLVPVPGAGEVQYGIAVPAGDFFLQQVVQSFLIASQAKDGDGVWDYAWQATLGRSPAAREAKLAGTQPAIDGLPLQDSDDRPPATVARRTAGTASAPPPSAAGATRCPAGGSASSSPPGALRGA